MDWQLKQTLNVEISRNFYGKCFALESIVDRVPDIGSAFPRAGEIPLSI